MTPAESLVEAWAAFLPGPGFRRLSTARNYRRALLAFVRSAGVTDLSNIETLHLDAYVSQLQIEGKATSTIRGLLIPIRLFFEWACARGHLAANPATPALMRVPPDDRNERPVAVLDFEDLARLYAAAAAQAPERGKREPEKFFEYRVAATRGQAVRDRAYLLVSYAAALRVSEAAALQWADVLAPDKRDGGLAIVIRTSKRSKRPSPPVYLGEEASRALREWKVARGKSGKSGASVFGLSASACAAVFDRCVRLAGLSRRHGRRLTPHALRSSRATHAAASGLSDREVADLLRHSGIESVTRYIRANHEGTRRLLALASLPENASKGLVRRREVLRRRKREIVGGTTITRFPAGEKAN